MVRRPDVERKPRRGKPVASRGMVYESVVQAAKANGLSREQLRFALNRKKNPGWISGVKYSYVVWLVDDRPKLR